MASRLLWRRPVVFEVNHPMTSPDEPTVVKKYADRRLYNSRTCAYVALEDLAGMVRQGEDFVILDAKSGEDITRSILMLITSTPTEH
jgi:polyhydroxyalkanoate synthesis regulator protein